MTILKGHSAVPGSKSPHGPTLLLPTPPVAVFLSFQAFCFKGGTLRMFPFACVCRCNSLPSDAPSFFSWENPQCALRDGHMRPRSHQHTQASAIFLQTKPAGPRLAIPPEIADMATQSGAWALFAGEAPWLAPGQSPQPRPSPRRWGRRAVPCRAGSALLFLCSAQQPRGDGTADTPKKALDSVSPAEGGEMNCSAPSNWQSRRRRV